MKYCSKCGKKMEKEQKFCPNCGAESSEKNKDQKKKKSVGKIVLLSIVAFFSTCFLILIITSAIASDDANTDFSQYQELNPQDLHRDFINNEISAEEKYRGNQYRFTGTIYSIEQFLTDNYIEIRYPYDDDNSKVIELDAYFKYNSEEIKSLNKDDTVTVYCKFKQMAIENYKNKITTYTFENCKLNNQ